MQDSDDDYGDYDQEDFSQEASDDDYGYEDMGEDDDEPSSRLPTVGRSGRRNCLREFLRWSANENDSHKVFGLGVQHRHQVGISGV